MYTEPHPALCPARVLLPAAHGRIGLQPVTVINDTINLVTDLKKTNESRLQDGIEPLHEGTVAERLFCTDTFYENEWGLDWCQTHAARNMLSLVVGLPVLVELAAAYRVGEVGRKKGKEGEEGGSLGPAVYACFP